MPVLYEAKVHATGGRTGTAESTDGQLKVQFDIPELLGGAGQGTNPEQLFAAGYAACFETAMRFVAKKTKRPVQDISIDAAVGLMPYGETYRLRAALTVTTTGLSQFEAETLVHMAHEVCAFSNAIRGNVNVAFNVVAKQQV